MTEDELDPTRLQELLDATAKLPREVEPARDGWPEIRRRIEAQKVASRSAAHGRRRIVRAALLAVGAVAASLTIMVLASRSAPKGKSLAVTAPTADSTRLAPTPVQPVPPTQVPATRAPSAAQPPAVPLSVSNPTLAATLDRYTESSGELEAEVAKRSGGLSPETRAVVKRSLATIDSAIAELRAAIGASPKDKRLGESISLVYEQKLDFLKRVRAIPVAGM